MSHFNLKSLTFYGASIVSVVVLFSIVTAYGETKIKAPIAITGNYPIDAQKLPGCLKSEVLVLTIQQSGTYLSASLLPANNVKATAREKKPSLDGKLNARQLSLSGLVPGIKSCNSSSQVKIEGLVEEKAIANSKAKNLSGQINLNSNRESAEFTAQQETPTNKDEKH